MIQKKATGPPSFIFTKSSIKESLKIPFCGTIIKQFRSNQEDLVLYRNQTKSMSKPEHLSLYPYQNYFPSKSEDQMYLCNKSSRPPPPIPFTKWNLTVFHRPRSLPLNKPRLSYFRPRQGGHSPTHTKKKRQMNLQNSGRSTAASYWYNSHDRKAVRAGPGSPRPCPVTRYID